MNQITFAERELGLHIFSVGPGFEQAYVDALRFIQEENTVGLTSERVLLLGPAIGDAGKQWIVQSGLANGNVGVGDLFIDWKVWIANLARDVALTRGTIFREVSPVEEREFLRSILRLLEERKLLPTFSGIWESEKFFSELLQTVRLLREKGFSSEEAIENLKKQAELDVHGENELRENDLWTILTAWSLARKQEAIPSQDFAQQLAMLLEEPYAGPKQIFLLGFESFGALEMDWLEKLANDCVLYWPVSCAPETAQATITGKKLTSASAVSQDSLVQNTLQRLRNSISQSKLHYSQLSLRLENRNHALRVLPFAVAHTPLEEIRSFGQFLRINLVTQPHIDVQVIAPRKYFQDQLFRAAWEEACPAVFQQGFPEEAILDHPLVRFTINSLRFVAEDFPVAAGIELLLSTQFAKIPERSTIVKEIYEKGLVDGYQGWIKFCDDILEKNDEHLIRIFVDFLRRIRDLFSKASSSVDYETALHAFLNDSCIYELIFHSKDAKTERLSHGAIASLHKAAAQLSINLSQDYNLTQWLMELQAYLARTKNQTLPIQYISTCFVYPGEWVPPPRTKDTLIVLLGFDSEYDAPTNSSFFTKEADRLILADWGLSSSRQEEGTRLDWLQVLIDRGGPLLLSNARFDVQGKDTNSSFLELALQTQKLDWPSYVPESIQNQVWSPPELMVTVKDQSSRFYSATALDRYQTCPYRYFAERKLNVQEVQSGTELDWQAKETGTLAHRALELFFQERSNWIFEADFSKVEVQFNRCFNAAYLEMEQSFFVGGEELAAYARERLVTILWQFVVDEITYLREHPELDRSVTEVKFVRKLENGIKIRGSIDRLDIDTQNKNYLVWDYKSGSKLPTNPEIRSCENLQLGLYLWAAGNLNYGSPAGAAFLPIRSGGRKNGVFFKEFSKMKNSKGVTYYENQSRSKLTIPEFEPYVASLLQEVDQRTQAIESGQFPVQPAKKSNCDNCNQKPHCRITEELPYLDKISNIPSTLINPSDYISISDAILESKELKRPVCQKKELRFSEEQERALSTRGKLVFLEASAGSGKTTILVERYKREIEYLLTEKKLSPERAVDSVLAISFTEKSAAEIKERLTQYLIETYGPSVALNAARNISTIHGFNQRLIRENATRLGVDPMFEVLDELAREELLVKSLQTYFRLHLRGTDSKRQEAIKLLFRNYSRVDLEQIFRLLIEKRGFWSRDKNLNQVLAECPPADSRLVFVESEKLDLLRAIDLVFGEFTHHYSAEKRKLSVLDFNDLEILSLNLKGDAQLLQKLRGDYNLILVDEFQDTNLLQRDLVEMIARYELSNVFVVGDAKQSIYRFRAADVSVFQTLKKNAAKFGIVCELNSNFRSQAGIVEFANELSREIFPDPSDEPQSYEASFAAANPKKDFLRPVEIWRIVPPEGKTINQEEAKRLEAMAIVRAIAEWVHNGGALSQITLLFKKLNDIDAYTNALRKAKIPFVLGSKSGFYDQQIIRDGVALLRAVFTEKNLISTLAILRSPWMRVPADKLAFHLNSESPFAAVDWLHRLVVHRQAMNPAAVLNIAYQNHPLYCEMSSRTQMDKLCSIVAELEATGLNWIEVIDRVSQFTDWNSKGSAARSSLVPDPQAHNAVQILTVHAAKGLEFPFVILADLDSGGRADQDIIRYDATIGCSLKWRDDRGEFTYLPSYEEMRKELNKRNNAEDARLFYVAVTRACEHLLLINAEKKAETVGKQVRKNRTKSHQANFTRSSVLKDVDWGRSVSMRTIKGEELNEVAQNVQFTAESGSKTNHTDLIQNGSDISRFPAVQSISVSVSELASYLFCPEFHRLKFVQRWEDSVVDARPGLGLRQSHQFLEVSPALQKLGISKKERGVSLHRLLEKIDSVLDQPEVWRGILQESYLSLGAGEDEEALGVLIEEDVLTIQTLLNSDLGREIFVNLKSHYVELPMNFVLGKISVSGAIDRVIQREDSSWVVIDYKSASEGLASKRYTLQVQLYMYAMKLKLKRLFGGSPKVSGWIVDLYCQEKHEILPADERFLTDIVQELTPSYERVGEYFRDKHPSITGSASCLVCPYTPHCATGSKHTRQR